MTTQPVALDTTDDIALADRLRESRDGILAELDKIIVGQRDVVDQVLLSLFVGGNSLIVGVPGLAKTLLIRTVADALDLSYSRIQFTPDLMPSDITGTDLVQEDPETGQRRMVFMQGPVFANIVLADEINRTPPKTQAALLEAMQEHRVTVQGRTYELAEPFFVFATQNPIELEGTYPLPEAQLDRFMFNIVIGYSPEEEELDVVRRTTATAAAELTAAVTGEDIVGFQALVRRVPVAEPVLRYALAIVRASRPGPWEGPGARVRAVSRHVRGHPGAGASGAAASAAQELSCGVRGHVDRRARRPAARGRAHAIVGSVTATRFLDPAVLARISNLELLARTVVDGFISGLHHAPYLGFSLDFAEHRAYMPGDDIRRIDWRVFGRTDRLYVKEFEADTNANFSVVFDVSRSMDYGSGAVTKLDYGRYLAACLAHFSRRQRDRIGIATFDEDIVEFVPPSAKHLDIVLHTIDRIVPRERRGSLERPLRRVAEGLRRRSIVVVISDFYESPEVTQRALGHLRFKGCDVIAFHLLDPAEIDLPFDEAAQFEDLESGERIPVVPDELRAEYRALVAEHRAALQERLGPTGVDYYFLDISRPLDHALFHYLSRRERLSRTR
jgi:MoxR-like ATPase